VDHAATIRLMYDRINAGDIDGFGDLMADDHVEHLVTPGLEPTKEGVKQLFHMYRAAFPDMHFQAEDVLPCGDKVVARVRITGTNNGELMGMPATGKRVDVQLIDIIRFDDDGHGCEHWGVFDALGMMQQLGAIPAPAAA
jgi:predicted ester cyclase